MDGGLFRPHRLRIRFDMQLAKWLYRRRPLLRMFSIRNAVVLAVLQVAVIIAGIFGAGAGNKMWNTMNDPLAEPASLAHVLNFGPLALVIPPVWMLLVLFMRRNAHISDKAKSRFYGAGVCILAVLILLIIDMVVGPWFGLDWRFTGAERH